MNKWYKDCIKWRGELLSGKYAHWCPEWDDLPVDETCIEFIACSCYEDSKELQDLKEKIEYEYQKHIAEGKSSLS